MRLPLRPTVLLSTLPALSVLLALPVLGAASARAAEPGPVPRSPAATAPGTAQEAVQDPAHVRVPTADRPVRRGDGDGTAGTVPIVLGLLLTAVAVYKHRGLPRGH